MAKRRKEDPPKGLAPWMATFSDLMNLLLCFFVLLFSMSTVDAEKFEQVAASLANSFSVLQGGGSAIGEGILISSGVSQLSELDSYFTSMGKSEEGETTKEEQQKNDYESAALAESEKMSEEIEQMLNESGIKEEVDMDFNSHYVLLTLNGALLFDSGKAEIKQEAISLIDKIGLIIQKYEDRVIEIEGHTDNVPIHNSQYRNNNELSSERALAVLEYLIEEKGIDPVKLKASGRGEYVPIADNTTEEGRARNRRVEFKIYNSYSD